MNYVKVREQAELKKFIKSKLLEKSEALRSLQGSEKHRAEQLIITLAKEEFKMGYKNSHELQKEKELKSGGDEAQKKKAEKEAAKEAAEKAEKEAAEAEVLRLKELADQNPDLPTEPVKLEPETVSSEKKLEDMDEAELKEYALKNNIDLGNSSSKNGMLKKILNKG